MIRKASKERLGSWFVVRRALSPVVRRLPGFKFDAASHFVSERYQRLDQRRLEHLASLELELSGKSVLELGAGIGNHTQFFVDRNCRVTTTDGRLSNVKILRQRYENLDVRHFDLDRSGAKLSGTFDVVYCYGTLYHLERPAGALALLSQHCSEKLLLETCVSFGDRPELNPCAEKSYVPDQALRGKGCRPTRSWIWHALAQLFEHVYVPVAQPWHEQFPVEWNEHQISEPPARAIFVASRKSLQNRSLVAVRDPRELPTRQKRGCDT